LGRRKFLVRYDSELDQNHDEVLFDLLMRRLFRVFDSTAVPRRVAARGLRLRGELLEPRQLLTVQNLPLVETDPRGWVLLDGKTIQSTASAGSSDYAINLQSGQQVAASVGSASAGTTLQLKDPFGNVVAQASAAATQVAVINPVMATTSGVWTITVGIPTAANGKYTLEAAVNAQLEGNDTSTGRSTSIDSSYTVLQNGVGRYAVLGTSYAASGSDVDLYQVSLAGKAGHSIDIRLTGRDQDFSGQKLELLDSNGSVLATASPVSAYGDSSPSLRISGFTVPTDGVYRLRLTSTVTGSYGLIVSDGQASTPIDSTAVLNWLVTGGWTTATSVNNLLSTLSFDRVFLSLSNDELLNALARSGLSGSYGDVGSYKAAIAAKSIDLSRLRPDGILTALATAPGGSLLASSQGVLDAPAAKAALQTAFNGNRAQFLNVFSPSELISLFDDSISAGTGVVDEIWAYSHKTVPSGYDNVVAMYPLWVADTANFQGVPTPQQAVAATSAMPAGHRVIFLSNFAEVAGFGGGSAPGAGYVDPYTTTGSLSDYYMLWNDYWQQIVQSRITSFFTQYKQLGGQLDTVALDVEDNMWSYYAMLTVDHRLNPTPVISRSIWQAILNDPRWPALQQQLVNAGIPASDLALNKIGTWDVHSDNAARWNAVMEQRLIDSLNRAIYQPLQALFPNIHLSNYNSSFRTQTLPAGQYDLYDESYYSAGNIVGTDQSRSLYGDVTYVSTPSGISEPPTPFDARIAQISFVQNYNAYGQPTNNGVATVQFFSPIVGIHVGDQILIQNRGSNYIDSQYTGSYTVLYISPDGMRLRYWMPIASPAVIPAAVDLTSRANAYNTAYVVLWQPYQTFVSEVKFLRTQVAASSTPLMPWISDRDWLLNDQGTDWTYYPEMVFHAALSGTDNFLWWKYSWDPDPANTSIVSRLLDELNPLIGYADRKTLSLTNADWSDGYVLTGMEANGRRVWRLTPDPTQPVTVLSSSGDVRIQIGSQVVSIPNSSIYTPSNPVSTLGYWIVQTKGTTSLTAPAQTVTASFNSQLTAAISGPAQGLPASQLLYTLTVNSPFVPSSTLYTFNIDWTGDGRFDQTVVGKSGLQVSAYYSVPGTYNIRVVASVLGGNQTLPAAATTVTVLTPGFTVQPDPSNPRLTNLIYAGTNASDLAIFSTPAPGTVQALVNGQTQTFTGITGRIFAYGLGGDDNLIAVGSNMAVCLFGGDGNDMLIGGNGDDVLYGQNGNDTILGGSGNDYLWGGGGNDLLLGLDGNDTLQGGNDSDVLIGGAGADVADGGAGSDLVVSGTTSWDNSITALNLIQAEWTSARSYSARVANLMGTGSGTRANGSYFLIPKQTAIRDSAVDQIFGGADQDFLLGDSVDLLADRTSDEMFARLD
jgi:Ca2+-binding RTX toxin-like protein